MAKKTKEPVKTALDYKEDIISTDYSEEMQKSYIDYAMSVIVGRAFPDIRDGLKPVQRRVLYAMDELGLSPTKPYKKCARIVGDAMGKYHPHGDSSIYGALVTMSKDWYYNYPLVDGHGNFGSIEGDGAAAMRYTEARLSDYSYKYLFSEINNDTVDFVRNFDDTEKEPSLLPSKIPNFLISGSEGIACGMATNSPSHNAGEVMDAAVAYINNNNISLEKLMEYIPGPDFATGGVIANGSAIKEIYETGNGKLRIRGKVEVEDAGNGKKRLVVTELPTTMIGAIDKFMESVADLVRTKKAPDISDIANQSSKEGIRIVIELRRGADVQKNLNILYKKTKLEDTFGVNMLAVKDNQPKVYSLKEAIAEYVEFMHKMYTRKYKKLLADEEVKREIKDGLLQACGCIDLIVAIIRGSTTPQMVHDCLTKGITTDIKFKNPADKKDAEKLCFSDRQANAIVEMKLIRLVGLEIEILRKELEECERKIAEYKGYLEDETKMKHKLISDMKQIKKEIASPRRTEIVDTEEIQLSAEPVEECECVALIDRFRYVKTIDMPTYERNLESIPNDYVQVIITKNTDELYLFTDKGVRHKIKIMDIPMLKYKDRGTPLENLSNLEQSEQIVYTCTKSDADTSKYLFVSSDGLCKIVPGTDFDAVRKTIDATKLNAKKHVVYVGKKLDEITEIVFESSSGKFLRFNISEISEMHKISAGMRGINIADSDEIVGIYVGNQDDTLTTTKDKTVKFTDIPLRKRAGKGSNLGD